MNNVTFGLPGPVEPVAANGSGSSPGPLEVVLGILAVVLGVAAVTVAIAQFRQAGAAERLRQAHRQSGQPDIDMPNLSVHDIDTDPHSVVVTTSK
jgi:uncharacterized protein HemX